MVATKEYIEELRQTSRMNIDASLEAYILSEYGEEPFHTPGQARISMNRLENSS